MFRSLHRRLTWLASGLGGAFNTRGGFGGFRFAGGQGGFGGFNVGGGFGGFRGASGGRSASAGRQPTDIRSRSAI